jgi:hypothetical protein
MFVAGVDSFQRAAWLKSRRGLGMTCLSIVTEDRPATVAANPIFILSQVDDRRGAEIAFEVFERDVGILKTLIGKKCLYYINPSAKMFWGGVNRIRNLY